MPYPNKAGAPILLIGSGYSNLLAARVLDREKVPYLLCDRQAKMGGVWNSIANDTSKIQTEHAVYTGSLEYEDVPDHQGEFFPHRRMVNSYMVAVSRSHGIDMNFIGETNVERITMVGNDFEEYKARLRHIPTGQTKDIAISGSIAAPGFYPGPLKLTLPGEENFAGPCCYGVGGDFPVTGLKEKNVLVFGSGAFAIESVRTAVENGAGKVYQVSRKVNIVTPRVIGYVSNSEANGDSMEVGLKAANPMYNLVHRNVLDSSTLVKTMAGYVMTQRNPALTDLYMVAQQARFSEAIGGWCETVHRQAVTLDTGRRLEVDFILKNLGADLNPRAQLDDVYDLKIMHGFWVNRDPSHMVFMTSSRSFGVTAYGPTSNLSAMLPATLAFLHFNEHPEDFYDNHEKFPTLTTIASVSGVLGVFGSLAMMPGFIPVMSFAVEIRLLTQRQHYRYRAESKEEYEQYRRQCGW